VKAKKALKPHARRQRDRIIGVERHHQRRYRGGNAGRDEHRAFVHAGIAENLRIDEDDVNHRQESGQSGDEFGARIGAGFGQAENLLQQYIGTFPARADFIHVGPCPELA